ncbi:MAG: sulfatase-like hydrolase/transferase, partial [Gemmataceae bacterium]
FEWDRNIYDSNDWGGRNPGQPFFMQVQLHGGKHRGQVPSKAWQNQVRWQLGSNTNPGDVLLPPYYPRDPIILQDWAEYLDCCRWTDKEVGEVIARLEREKILDQTVVFFMTDHGISHARGKQFLYDEGIRIPFIVRGPGIAQGMTRNDLIEHIDMATTSLVLAGISIPAWMQGKNIISRDYRVREAVFAARDRCDETMDRIRCVRTTDHKYIRNYMPQRPHLQPCEYKDEKAIIRRLRELHSNGKLDALTEKLLFSPSRPPEELYDLAADPFETTNLADDPRHRPLLATMRQRLATWEEKTGDRGRTPESMERYDSDMAVYLNGNNQSKAKLKSNIEQNKQWAKEGK